MFTSKYYFPDDDELLLVEGKPILHPDMEEEIRELADPEDKPEQVCASLLFRRKHAFPNLAAFPNSAAHEKKID